MKKLKELFKLFPEITSIEFTDSGEAIKVLAGGGEYHCTTLKEIKDLIKLEKKRRKI